MQPGDARSVCLRRPWAPCQLYNASLFVTIGIPTRESFSLRHPTTRRSTQLPFHFCPSPFLLSKYPKAHSLPSMTEYDYSAEGRQRYLATQTRITNWVNSTPSPSQLSSPFSPSSHTGSHATTRSSHSSSSAHSHRAPQTRSTYGSPSHQPSRALGSPSCGGLSSHVHIPPSSSSSFRSGSGSRPFAASVTPSQSISQAPMRHAHSHSSTHRSSSSSHHSSHHSHSPVHSHSNHHYQRQPSAYIISPPPSRHAHRTPGIIIFPRVGHSPQVVVRHHFFFC